MSGDARYHEPRLTDESSRLKHWGYSKRSHDSSEEFDFAEPVAQYGTVARTVADYFNVSPPYGDREHVPVCEGNGRPWIGRVGQTRQLAVFREVLQGNGLTPVNPHREIS